jgi:uncharacterized repeat protein (TIGR02543 family)
MRNKNIKNAMVCLTAFVFLCTTFLPTVHSQLGTGISIQSQQNTTTKNPVQDVENTYLPKNSDSTSRTSKPGSPLPFDNDPPNVHLPTSQVTLKVFSSTTSYFRTLLSNVPSGYEVHNGNYTGWCSDNAHTINLNTAYQVILYSSYNTSLPTHLVHQNWSKVNYILNHKVGSDWHQVEYSILYILNFGNQGLNTNGWSMVNASILYGGSYVPNGGDIIAIIADAGTTVQRTIFELTVPTYSLTVTITGQGNVTKNPNQTSYTYSQNVLLTAVPSAGWSFSQWGGNLSGSTNPAVISMTGNKTVTATFSQNVYTLTITVNPTAGGSVAAVPSPPYHYGDVVTLTASANIGYKFDHWSGNASGTSSVTTVTMNGNKSVTAHFTQRVYTLTITINPTAGGSVAAVPSPPYHYGDVVTLTATANVGYRFDHWSGNASGTSSITTVTMNGNKSVTAHFTQKVYTLTITVNPTAGGSVAAVPSPPYHYGDVVTLTATANPGYTFDHWSGNASGSSSVTTVTMNGNKSVMAHFIQSAYTLTITVNPAAGGSVTADPGPPYYYNDTVTLTATANPGYAFDHWSGDASGSSTVTTVTMNGNKSVTAHFTQKQYTLTITIEGHGTVLKDPYQTTYPYNTVVELTAVPDTNWVFSSWSGDLTGDQNPDTITMTGNKTVTAHFIQAEDTTPPVVEIAAPGNAIYFMNKEIIPFKTPIVILSFTIGVNASDNGSGVNRVEFYIDGVLKENDTSKPYTCDWKDFRSGKRTIKAVAYDNAGNSASTELQVFKWRLHPVLLLILLVLGMILDSWDSPWQT